MFIEGRRAVPARTEHERALELVIRSVQIHKQLQYFVDNLFNARIGAVDLVDNDDEFQAHLQRLLRNKARLRHGTLCGVHKDEHARDHFQNAFHFAREIGVTGRIDNIDLDALIVNGRILGKNGDAALALESARVHDALLDDLVFAEGARLFEHLIDQRRLAVVDVGDDRNVP